MTFDYDLFVIGGGSGGVRAARVSAATGARVALAEDSRLGGTCVIRGCVPKKLMVFASGYRAIFGEARAYGWDLPEGLEDRFRWGPFAAKMNDGFDRLEGVYRKMLVGSGVEIFDQRAKLSDPHTIELADGKTVTAKHILIAVGGHPVRPDRPGAELGMVSDDIFHMENLPESVLIVGGGYIACEFACILTGMGVKVTQYYRGAQVLRGFDDEARGLIAEAMKEQGVDLHVGTDIVEMMDAETAEADPDARMGRGTDSDAAGAAQRDTTKMPAAPGRVWIKATNGHEGAFDRVLFATGRAPNTRDLGLEEAGIELGRKGEILVDEFSQTGVPSVYAIGDATNRVNLTPVAIREGMAFVETVFKGNPTPVDHDLIPSAIFTQPEMGTVGMTEEAARDAGEIDVYCTSFRPMQSAFAGKSARVLMKLVVSKESRVVLGCHIVAPQAGEMIQLAGIAVKMGATKEDFDRTVAVHPTMSEELVTMKTPTRSS